MNSLERRLRAELEERKSHGLARTLRNIPADVLDLASNDYLGLARHPAVIEAAREALPRFGSGARASRLISGHTEVHTELEAEIAAFKGCEAALLFPSGYMVNLGVITALARKGDFILCDKRNHASLIDACRLAENSGARVRYYNSPDKARALLATISQTREDKAHIFIISDAVYSMDGDICDLRALLELAREFEATLILDDAHGTGTLGATGRGTVEHFGLMTVENGQHNFGMQESVIQVGTLSKALGSQGGFVAGTKWLIEWLINAARPFIYATALNPASCGAALAALRLLQSDDQLIVRLGRVKNSLAQGLQNLGFDVLHRQSPVLPVIIGGAGKAVEMSDNLLDAGVWCPAVRPPTVPQGTSRLRVTASAALSDSEVSRALAAFAAVKETAF